MKRLVLFVLVFMPFILKAQTSDHSNFRPMPVPQWSAPLTHTGTEHYFVGYNVGTKDERVISTDKYQGLPGGERSEPFIPSDAQTSEEVIGAKNFNDLVQVTGMTTYPWSAVVKLFMTFPSTAQFVGSGILINSRYVLTAGHCVYSSAEGGWATSIEVVPGYENGSMPNGNAYATNMYSWTGWTNSGDFNWDMGYIRLDSDIGTTTGYLGYGYNNDAFFQTNTFHNPGYPAESPYDGSLMYYWYGTYDQVMTKLLYFNKYCYGGQSGSGSYYKDGSNNRYVYAILSHYSSVNGTGHVRITGDMFSNIHDQIYSIGENGSQQEIGCQLFPNPATEVLHLTLDQQHKDLNIRIFDFSGKQVLEMTANTKQQVLTLDIAKLVPGFYTISIADATHSVMKHFVKQ